MGPTYRIAVLVNGKYEWLIVDGKVYETCTSLDAHAYSDNRPNSRIVSSWDDAGQHHNTWELPKSPKLNHEQVFELLVDAAQTAFDNLKPAYSSDHLVIKKLKSALCAAAEI